MADIILTGNSSVLSIVSNSLILSLAINGSSTIEGNVVSTIDIGEYTYVSSSITIMSNILLNNLNIEMILSGNSIIDTIITPSINIGIIELLSGDSIIDTIVTASIIDIGSDEILSSNSIINTVITSSIYIGTNESINGNVHIHSNAEAIIMIKFRCVNCMLSNLIGGVKFSPGCNRTVRFQDPNITTSCNMYKYKGK
jgi:hypothetical protein